MSNIDPVPFLDPNFFLQLLREEGPVASHLKNYEKRGEQLAMLLDVVAAFNEKKIALIEAGTGTGKSLAYLIPAIFLALHHQIPSVISTNTIALQQQLIEKDIPFLTETLQIPIKTVLVKGMSNYLCQRKLNEATDEKRLLAEEDFSELEKIEAWAANTKDGSKAELSFVPTLQVWEKVGAEADACNHSKCPHFKECFFFKARKNAEDAKLLIVNHHLLFADIAARSSLNNYEQQMILPPYQNVIMDESHHIEDVATEYFANRVSRLSIVRLLSRISTEGKEKSGKLFILKQKIQECFPKGDYSEAINALLLKIEMEIPAKKRHLLAISTSFFEVMKIFLDQHGSLGEENPNEKKLRLRQLHYQNIFWQEKILILSQEVIKNLIDFSLDLKSLITSLEEVDELVCQKTAGLRVDINAILVHLEKIGISIKDFVSTEESKDHVKWIESHQSLHFTNVHLVNARLEIATTLQEFLFKKFQTIVLCSATLTANHRFDYLKNRLGLDLMQSEKIIEKVYASPFDYKKQALIAIPTDMPDPQSSDYIYEASKQIWQCIEASGGGVFVLFTSYQMLKACFSQIISKIEGSRYKLFRQGEDNRKSLLDRFKTTPKAILFGTDSFWEGVDVVGDALRCVILVKLPFKVPSEPLIQARLEAISERGGNPFMEYTIPSAIVKFKQGFGRLIRNRKDRGCVICLDPRLLQKGYGKLFLNSLPDCEKYFSKGEELKKTMVDFYKKTYYLTK